MKDPFSQLLGLLKALADGTRLRIVGLLSQESYSVEQLAAMVGLSPATVSHHLSRLAEVGLVSARAEGYYSVYQLELQVLAGLGERLAAAEILSEGSPEVDLEAYDREVLQVYLRTDGTLESLPAQDRKLAVVLRHVASAFEPGLTYTQREADRILTALHPDAPSLRDRLMDAGLLLLEEGRYWRPEA